MSTDSLIRRPVHYVDEEDTSDLFTLIWLDENCKDNNRDILRTKLLLIEINNNCLFYDDFNQFRDYFENNYYFDTKTLLIISGSYVEILLKDFDDENIPSLIIFCRDDKKYEKYFNSLYVIGVCNNHHSLKTLIENLLPGDHS